MNSLCLEKQDKYSVFTRITLLNCAENENTTTVILLSKHSGSSNVVQ
jgi:hypothetical protein